MLCHGKSKVSFLRPFFKYGNPGLEIECPDCVWQCQMDHCQHEDIDATHIGLEVKRRRMSLCIAYGFSLISSPESHSHSLVYYNNFKSFFSLWPLGLFFFTNRRLIVKAKQKVVLHLQQTCDFLRSPWPRRHSSSCMVRTDPTQTTWLLSHELAATERWARELF